MAWLTCTGLFRGREMSCLGQLQIAGPGHCLVNFQLVLGRGARVVHTPDQQQRCSQGVNPVPNVKCVDSDQVSVLGDWAHLGVALHQVFPQVGFDKHHGMALKLQPFPVDLRIFDGVETHVERSRRPYLGAHGHGHQHQGFDFFRVVQGVLQSDAGAQRESDQHQVFGPVLGPEPTPDPFGVAGDVGARLPFQVPRQIGRQTSGEMRQLVYVGIGATAGAGTVDEDELTHNVHILGRGPGVVKPSQTIHRAIAS